MNKNRNNFTSFLSGKQSKLVSLTPILLSIVAIIECLMLISFTTYSWIESASSLIITDEVDIEAGTGKNLSPMEVTDNLNFKFNIDDSSTDNYINLSEYFSDVKFYEFARASSANGKTMFFPRTATDSDGNKSNNKYRKGDTTDNNTSFNYFDFEISNSSSENLGYLFKLEGQPGSAHNIFTINSDSDELDAQDKLNAAKAFRISISSDNNSGTNNTHIYSFDGSTVNAVSSITKDSVGTPTTSTQSTYSYESYGYVTESSEPVGTLFSVVKGSSSASSMNTFVSIRIWLEDKALQKLNFSDNKMNALLGSNVDVNLKFITSNNVKNTMMFDDYTFSNKVENLGGHITQDFTLQQNYRMVFVYHNPDNNKNYYYPMTTTGNSSDVPLRWVTCDSSGSATGTIDMDYITSLSDDASAYNNSYFYYGLFDLSNTNNKPGTNNPVTNPLYTWHSPQRALPDSSQGNLYNAYSFTTNYDDSSYGVGDWGDKSLSLVQFNDQTINNTNSAYNSDSTYQFITDENKQTNMYIDSQSVANANYWTVPTMYYDSDNEIWQTFIPSERLEENQTLYFKYFSEGKYNSTTNSKSTVTFATTIDSTVASQSDKVFTGLGYTENKLLSDKNLTGVGTWKNTELIQFSTEIIDNNINAAYRYKVSYDNGTNYVPMKPESNNLVYSAYIPIDYGKTGNRLKFEALETFNADTSIAKWDTGQRSSDSSIYYPVTFDGNSSRGSWNVAVLVDGTYDNLINDTTEGSNSGTVSYSLDGTNYINTNLIKVDQFRWAVLLDNQQKYISFKWQPYTNTVFTYSINDISRDGIYCIVTE